MNVNVYLAKPYPNPPCWALVADVYASELGQLVQPYSSNTADVRAVAAQFRLELHSSAHGFSQLPAPCDFAVVLMGKTQRLGFHHCGIFYKGKILHALETGTVYQEFFLLRDEYPLMQFWFNGKAL